MSDAGRREWRFYIQDMIGFAERVVVYTEGFDQAGFDNDVLWSIIQDDVPQLLASLGDLTG